MGLACKKNEVVLDSEVVREYVSGGCNLTGEKTQRNIWCKKNKASFVCLSSATRNAGVLAEVLAQSKRVHVVLFVAADVSEPP